MLLIVYLLPDIENCLWVEVFGRHHDLVNRVTDVHGYVPFLVVIRLLFFHRP